MSELRLHVHLARCGVGSRRACEQLILDGRVRVNGAVVRELGTKIDPERDHVKVGGRGVNRPEQARYLMLHKPRGFVSTASDPQGRPTVLDLVPGERERLFPVGRLDLQTEGLLLLTNDGTLTAALTHPRSEVPRTYQAKVRGLPTAETCARLAAGVVLDGRRTGPLRTRVFRRLPSASWVEVVVTEGRQHLVRDALALVGHAVSKLRRVAFGPLKLGSLARGRSRPLTAGELAALRRLVPAGEPADQGRPARRAKAPLAASRRASRSTQSHRKRSPWP